MAPDGQTTTYRRPSVSIGMGLYGADYSYLTKKTADLSKCIDDIQAKTTAKDAAAEALDEATQKCPGACPPAPPLFNPYSFL